MKKIIHLSDIHAGHDDCTGSFSQIADNIAFLKQPAENYIILISGDIADNANKPSFVSGALAVIKKMKDYGYTVLVVPGNHDYGTGSLANKKFVKQFKKKFYDDITVTYPKLDIIDGVAFIGLDSTAEELHWHDKLMAEGELGKDQLERLKAILDLPELSQLKKVIYLHHHPFDFELGRQLKDRKKLKKIIEGKVDAILFGHYHHTHSAGKIFHGAWGINRCYNAGSATHKKGNAGYHRVIDLSYDDPRMDYDGCFI